MNSSNKQNVAKVMGVMPVAKLHYIVRVKGFYRYNQDPKSVGLSK